MSAKCQRNVIPDDEQYNMPFGYRHRDCGLPAVAEVSPNGRPSQACAAHAAEAESIGFEVALYSEEAS